MAPRASGTHVPRISVTVAALAVMLCTAAAKSQAQTPEAEVGSDVKTLRVPAMTVSFAAGAHLATEYSQFNAPEAAGVLFSNLRPIPIFQASVQFPVAPHLVLEGEFSGSSTEAHFNYSRAVGPGVTGGACQRVCPGTATTQLDESRRAVGVGTNILFKTGLARLSVFGGGGVALDRVSGDLAVVLTCQQALAGGCAATPNTQSHRSRVSFEPRWLLTYGVDVVLSPMVTTFAAFRWTGLGRADYDSNDFKGTSLNGGIRVAMTTRSTGPDSREVRVTPWHGRTIAGTLISLTDTEVIVRNDDGVHTVPLLDVKLVKKPPRAMLKGGLAGMVAAGIVWTQVAVTRDSCADCQDGSMYAESATLLAVGAATGIGAAIAALPRASSILYRGRRGGTVTAAPLVSPKLAGANVSLSW